MKEKKKVIISIFCVLSVMLIAVGLTYSIFTYTKQGETENTVTTGKLTFLYTENTGTGTGINITNAFPVSDELGKAYSGDNQVFDFKVESEIVGNAQIPYEVTVGKTDTSTLGEEYIKLFLTDTTEDNEVELLEPTLYSELPESATEEDEKQIYFDEVEANENYLKKFRLRMWIKEDSNQEEINEKEFTVKVNVYSDENVVKKTYSSIYVSAVDSEGNDLRATASTIIGGKREILLEKLQESGYISNINEVDALIEVKSDEFTDIAETTFDVSNIAEEGDRVVILHFNEITDEWEYIGEDIVDENGTVTGNFTSFSPVAFVVVKNDNYELIPKKIYTIVADANSNGIADVGDEIRIGRTKEYFYVISNDGTNINALSKYNLNVGDNVLDATIGIQNANAIGTPINNNATLQYTSQNPEIETYYDGSILKEYVNNYVTYLNTNTPELNATGRLILKTEIQNLVNDGATLLSGMFFKSASINIKDKADAKGYSWIYSTSYWSEVIGMNMSGEALVCFMNASGEWGRKITEIDDSFGVRPVITIAA